ncbi:MAG: flagellar protein FlgN [Acidimicrobiales bacterium]
MTRGALERLARCLDEQLSALRHLCFKFEVQEIVLSGGRHQWLNETTGELERAVHRVHDTDRALRAALAQGAVALGLSPESTVREVADAAPEPWGYIFGQHREDLQRSIDRVAQLSRTNRQLLTRGHAATTSALQFLGADVPTGYDATGNAAPATGSVGLLNARA